MKNYTIKYSALTIMLATAMAAQAQQVDKNIIEQEQEKLLQQWDKSSNAAGLLLDKPTQNSNLEAGYKSTKGDFKQPQVGQQSNNIFLNTRGNLYLDKYYLQGHFSYKRNSIKDAEYNASIIEPLRLMPYIVADTNASDWINQHYDLGFKLTTQPIAEKLSLGVTTNYKSYSGAKQRDIRANNKYYELEVDPAIVYSISERHHIGANFHYRNFKEESTNSNVNTYVDQGYFFLFGLGNAISYVGSGRSMNYEGDALGAGLQYQYNAGSNKLFLSGNYTIQAEDANWGFTNTRPVGTILLKKWDAAVDYQNVSYLYTHNIKGSYSTSRANGIEYITQFVSGLESDGYYVLYKGTRSKYNTSSVSAQYDLLKNQADAYNWKASVFGTYHKVDNSYLIPASSLTAENLVYGVGFNKLFQVSEEKNGQLTVGAQVSFKNNLSGAYEYTGADTQELTVTDLETRNFQYLNSEFTAFEIPVVYTQRLKKESNTALFIKAKGQYISTDSFNFTDRKGFNVSIGASF